MRHIPEEMAEALIRLLEVIDSNSEKYPDWIDAVCTARENLPESTLEFLGGAAGLGQESRKEKGA